MIKALLTYFTLASLIKAVFLGIETQGIGLFLTCELMIGIDRIYSGFGILSPGIYLSYSFFLLLGFIFGCWFNHERHSAAFIVKTPPETISNVSLKRKISDTNTRLQKFSANKFSCNSVQAYEELTNLHKIAHSLTEHKRKGEANNARRATIARKAASAQSAEQAFRKCVNSMMPEVLQLWDDKFKRGQIDFNSWDDSKERANDGITLQVLEETADTFGQL